MMTLNVHDHIRWGHPEAGFWLYVVEIMSKNGHAAAYVGRTGDTSSANAASLFAWLMS
jgi:hypothetical protein